MNKKLLVPVPETVTASYFVPARESAATARDIAMIGVGEETRWLVENVPALTVDVVPGRAETLEGDWPADESCTGRGVMFRAACPTGIVAVHEWAARALAAGFARETKREFIADEVTGLLLSVDEARASLNGKEDGSLRMSDWVRVFSGSGSGDADDGAHPGENVKLTTAGLRRYGLPELSAEVPAWHDDAWSVVLTGLAGRILEEFCEAVLSVKPVGDPSYSALAPREIEIPAELELLPADVAAAYCLRGRTAPRGNMIRLSLGTESEGRLLTVRPPEDWEWSTGEFLESVAEGPLRSVAKAAELLDDLVNGTVDLEEFAEAGAY